MPGEPSSTPRFRFKLRNGSEIAVYENPHVPYKDSQINRIMEDLRTKYGRERQRRQADHRYNCHGLTFISKLGWLGHIEAEQQPGILSPDKLPGPEIFIDKESQVIMEILRGNGLQKICQLNTIIDWLKGDEPIQKGDIAIYKEFTQGSWKVNHSAIVMGFIRPDPNNMKYSNILMLSKFGAAGEFFHEYNKVDNIYGPIVEIWTDRKM